MASTINADDGVVSGSAGVKTSADNSGVLELQSNGTTQFTLGSSSVVINEAGADVDFRVEGDTDSNLLFVDASTDRIGVGTNAPGAKLDVYSTASEIGRMQGGTAGAGYLRFADTTNTNVGYVGRNNTSDLYVWQQVSGGSIRFGTENNQVAQLDSSGNLGIGVTPSAWLSTLKAVQVTSGAAIWGSGGNNGSFGSNIYYDSTPEAKYITSNPATQYQHYNGSHLWYTAASGTAGNTISFTQAMTLTSGGDLLVGTTSSYAKFHVKGTSAADVIYRLEPYSNSYASKLLISSISSGDGGIRYGSGGSNLMDIFSYGDMRFFCGTANISGTVGDERARITAAGYLLVGTTSSSTNQIQANKTGDQVLYITNTNSTGTPYGLYIAYPNLSPNSTAAYFISCQDSSANRMRVNSNGGIANYQANDINLSDERVKTDIKPVGSYWNKIKAIEIVAFKYKDQTHDDDNVGVIAQQVEEVAPEFINSDGWDKDQPEDGVPLKSVYTTDMYHAAIKALQEAMIRIEELETKVAALESK
jgi:hypothetical protein